MQRKYIYETAQRILHWWLALVTLMLMISGYVASKIEPGSDQAFLWLVHIQFGKLLVIGLLGRIAWGIVGPEHARFSALIHLKEWIIAAKTRKILSADSNFGHHPQASLSYLGFYGLTLCMVASGLLLAAIMHGEGPLAEKFIDDFSKISLIRTIHEYSWWALVFFVVTHIGALIFHEWYDRIPIAQSMISGYQYRTIRKAQKNDDET